MPHSTKFFARPGKLIHLLFVLLVLASTILAAGPAWAAEGDTFSLAEPDQEVYAQLASGKKVQQPKTYVQPDKPTVYLTFDDGPSKLTPRVLDILKEEGVPATFFVLGQEAEAHPDTVKRIVQEGHAIGNHTYDHVYSSLYGSFSEYWRQTQDTDAILSDLVGFHPRILRAPGGTGFNYDAFYFYYLDQAGYTVYDWNIDSGDSKRPGVPAKEIIDTVNQGPFEHEVILLMHDGTGHGESVKALPEIIKLFKEKGYTFATLSDKVRPAQFHIMKSKWTRSISIASFAKQLEQVRAFQAEHAEPAKPAAAPPEPLYNEVPLQLRFRGLGTAAVAPGGYELKQGMLRVPMRRLAERFGAGVSWDENKRLAKVHYGYRDIEYDLATMAMRTYVFGRLDRVYPLADMKLVDGSILVPLRGTAALFDNEVSDFSMKADDRFVALAPRNLAYFR